MYRIGIDVGGTNTDIALLDDQLNVIYSGKSGTTEDIKAGIYNVISDMLNQVDIDKAQIKWAMLGTTHCTNAIVERKKLSKVAVLRLGAPATTTIVPFTDWALDLEQTVHAYSMIAHGGYEYDGQIISDILESEIIDFCNHAKDKADAIAISGVFSSMNNEQEHFVAETIKKYLPDMPITLSSEVGHIGLLERENSAILNAALIKMGVELANSFVETLQKLDINAEVFFSQNDGTLMNYEFTKKYPIFTIGCGITNSIRGAAFLSKLKDAIILDIGGTTTDIGVLNNGFPRESALPCVVGGIHINFRMPDMISIGLGGGTIIKQTDADLQVGPQSVGYKLTQQALIFGGDILTLSDIAAKLGLGFNDKQNMVEHIETDLANKIMDKIKTMLEQNIDQMKTSQDPVPVIITGGGSIVCPEQLQGVSQIVQPEHYKSANAVGAALGQVSGNYERIYDLTDQSRTDAINNAVMHAQSNAIQAGANPETCEILNIEDHALAYMPGNSLVIKIKVIGDLKI